MKDAHGPPVTLDYDTWPLTNTPIRSIADQGVCALTWSDDFIRRDRYRAGDLLAFDNRRVLHGCDGYDYGPSDRCCAHIFNGRNRTTSASGRC